MNELDRRILAGRIKDLRLAYEETQEHFAIRLKMRLAMLQNYEIALRRPDYDDTQKFFLAAAALRRHDLTEYFRERMKGLAEWSESVRHYRDREREERS